MIQPFPSSRTDRRGFTLLELMVSIVIITIILLLTVQVSDSALDITRRTEARLAAQRQASVAAQQLRADFALRIQRLDTPVRFEKNPGNDSLALLTKRLGYPDRTETPDRAVSLTEYRIETDAPGKSGNGLLRASSGIGFGELTVRPDLKNGTLALASLPEMGPDELDARHFQMLTPGVIRLELSFLINDEMQPIRMEAPDEQELIDGVIATVCILDPGRRGGLKDGQLTRIADQFDDAVDGTFPIDDWLQTLKDLPTQLENFPKATLSHIRVKQILIPFNDQL
jgi:prepilin-type N-terminal cleavage/methylation domain-containing protein